MNAKWAEENLQTIRTLMERSALYRRALAPIMIYVGVVGVIAGMAGCRLPNGTAANFVLYWSGAALVALTGTFILVRRQALSDSEQIWSPPTKRIAQALLPSFVIGGFVGVVVAFGYNKPAFVLVLIPVWCLAFGCAMCAAGFFMPRGIKFFGWLFIACGIYLISSASFNFGFDGVLFQFPHLLMGGIFGGLHLAYGIYLYFTEKKNPVA